MGSPSKDLVELEGSLRVVIEHLIDAQEGLQAIGQATEDETLKVFFLAESLKRAQFRGELEAILHQDGVKDLHETGTAAGTFTRVWTGLKAKLGGGVKGMLDAAEDGEVGALEAYADALKKSLPGPVVEVLARQAADISLSLEYVRAAKEGVEAGSRE